MNKPIDIKLYTPNQHGDLSPYAAHSFTFRRVPCGSLDGLLQSLKTPDPERQRIICGLSGISTKHAGMQYDSLWQKSQTLWWQGQPMGRQSDAYESTLDEAFMCLLRGNSQFRESLKAVDDTPLALSIAGNDPTKTVLTEAEFVRHMNDLRIYLRTAPATPALKVVGMGHE